MTSLNPVLIETNAHLADCARCWREADALAVDTEFVRTDTFYPKLGLIQVCDGNGIWLVDPLAVNDFGPLTDVLAEPGIVKVFHSCSEDLEVLRYALDIVPAPVFDTQVAAGFLGYGFSLGYARLVEAVLDIALDKHETRSDWLQRPLSDSQCHYAAEDVHYLMRVYRRLVDELREKQRLAWVEADMGRLVEEAASVPPAGDYYRRIKGAWKLPPEGLARLQAMARWREQEAREMNRPRNRIVPDRVLLEVARRDPSSRQALFAIDDFHPRAVKRYGDRLLELCRAAAANADVPPDALPAPLDREARKHLATCRDIVEGRAKALGLAPEVLARKKELESLVRTALTGRPELPPALADGWRHAIIGEELLQHVRETPL